MVKDKKILGGATALGIGAFVSKLLGAIYRVPLTNLIGGFGLGLYQMVFPVYSVLLDFSGAGLPSALSKIISSNREENKYLNAEKYLKSSLKFFLIIGLLGTCLMAILSRPLSLLQGNVDAYFSYITLAPAVFLVALISCYRGYFQGLMNMKPTAISQVTEQVIKLFFGLFFAYIFLPNVPLAVAGATLSISFSELFAYLYLFIKHKRLKNKVLPIDLHDKKEHKDRVKKILKVTMPITFIGIMIPLSQVIDSCIIVNVLNGYRNDATALYGLLSGVVATVIGLPVSICYGISAVTIPAVSSATTELEKNKNATKTLALTFAVALPCAVFCALFSPFIINLLFKSLPTQEKSVAVNLLRVSSPCIVLLSVLQTGNAVLIGKGKFYKPILSLSVGIFAKIILSVILLKIPELNIYGGAISIIACYFISSLINLFMIFNLKVNHDSTLACRRKYAS